VSVVAWAQRGIARLDPGDRPTLAAFQREHFGERAMQHRPEHHRWLFEDVPRPDPEGVQLWVCKRKDAVVGQQGGIPFRLKAGERMLRASWSIDLMVAPEWRLRGVGPALTDAHAMCNEATVSLAPSDAAYKAYKRAGWLDLGSVPTYVRVIDPVPCVAVTPFAARLGRAGRAAAAVAGPVLATASFAYAAAALAAGARVEVVERFDERVDPLWRDAAQRYPVIAERSLDFLRWRFDRGPAVRQAKRLYITRRGQLMGYVVLRADRWRGVPVMVVLDYLVRPGWTAAAFALAVEYARRERAAALLCRTLNPEAARPLAAMGFACLKNGLNMPTRMLARAGFGAEDSAALLSDPANWYVTAADSDLGFEPLGFDPTGTT